MDSKKEVVKPLGGMELGEIPHERESEGGEVVSIEIRLCQSSDIPKVVELSQLFEDEDITYGLVANSTEILEELLGEYFFVAQEGSGIIGYIIGTTHVSVGLAVIPKGERYLEIDEIYVHRQYRSAGVGSLLVDRILQAAKEVGIERSFVSSATKQWERMVTFYGRHGFQMWTIHMFR